MVILCAGTTARVGAQDAELRAVIEYLQTVRQPVQFAAFSELKSRAYLVPDGLVYHVAKKYAELRGRGHDHARAIEELRQVAAKMKKYAGGAELRVTVAGSWPAAGTDTTLYTIQVAPQSIAGRVLAVRAGRRKISCKLSEPPKDLLQRTIRINKYFGRKPGLPEFPHIQDPHRPAVSKPFKVLVFRRPEIEFGLLIKSASLRRVEALDIAVANIKKYRGPFKDGRIDVNGGRRWALLPGMKGRYSLPDRPVAVPNALKTLVAVVRARF